MIYRRLYVPINLGIDLFLILKNKNNNKIVRFAFLIFRFSVQGSFLFKEPWILQSGITIYVVVRRIPFYMIYFNRWYYCTSSMHVLIVSEQCRELFSSSPTLQFPQPFDLSSHSQPNTTYQSKIVNSSHCDLLRQGTFDIDIV